MEKKVEVKDLRISFRTNGGKVQAVRDISFDLYKGETLAIVGESGSGKSVTSRAIMGILAGNSIIEGGEILYDGQDLLKISEDDFHKLRGDKIAMIFQDPMSSLNPIMKVGKQLTEAMILKGKSSQKNARRLFNKKLKLLQYHMDAALANSSKEEIDINKSVCHTFDRFCLEGTKLENSYNSASRRISELIPEIENLLFLAEKKQEMDVREKLSALMHRLEGVYNPFLVRKGSELASVSQALKTEIAAVKAQKQQLSSESVETLKNCREILLAATKLQKPNFFTLGYYVMRNPEFDVSGLGVKELDILTRNYLDEEFMRKFIDREVAGIKHSYDESFKYKQEVLSKIEAALAFFNRPVLDANECKQLHSELLESVEKSIDMLNVTKDSTAYTFKGSFTAAIKAYFDGLASNPKEQRKYDKQLAKRNALIAKGKTPDWKVVPAVVVDLDLARSNIRLVLHRLVDVYKEDTAVKTTDFKQAGIELVDFLKDQASAVVYKVTRRLAKLRAMKLLEEVGIPEPKVRFNQYPFEFSGGMRQRIVIAIALAANPDILICDEPTTALDVTIQSQILELINKIKAERNLSVIFITHDLGVVANMADRIAVMYAGKIVEYGTADDVFYDPRHPYTWALLSSMPDLDTKEKLEAIPGTPPNMIFPPKGDAFAARNKYALEIDFEQQPPLFEISDTHFASTWLLHPNAPSIKPPKIVTERIDRMKNREVR